MHALQQTGVTLTELLEIFIEEFEAIGFPHAQSCVMASELIKQLVHEQNNVLESSLQESGQERRAADR